jgi:2-oxo-3-(phosphooxy)propyl 3-oxoalkanoate synthase
MLCPMTRTTVTSTTSGTDVALDQLVPRALVHREGFGEVLIAGAARRSDNQFVAAGQAPGAHHYFGDHMVGSCARDLMLVQELVRQSVTVVAHEYLEVPVGSAFLVRRWRASLPTDHVPAPRAARRLDVAIGVRDLVTHKGALSGLVADADVTDAGVRIGTVEVSTAYLNQDRYDLLRLIRRSSTPPRSDQLDTARSPHLLAAAQVGRTNGVNVVLADVHSQGAGLTAVLDVHRQHATLFDHPLDHVPSMALMEAARQIAVLISVDSVADQNGYITAVDASFDRFIDLDELVSVVCEPAGSGFTMVVRQAGSTVATLDVERTTGDLG